MVQMIKVSKDEELALAVFTVEEFGGGNSHTQFFAAFTLDTDEDGKRPHFTLINVIPVAGKGWRGVQNLKIKITAGSKGGEKVISFEAYEAGSKRADSLHGQIRRSELARSAGGEGVPEAGALWN